MGAEATVSGRCFPGMGVTELRAPTERALGGRPNSPTLRSRPGDRLQGGRVVTWLVRLGVEALFGSSAGAGDATAQEGAHAMNDQAQAVAATRSVAVRFPSGESEYWRSDHVFTEDETLTRHGQVYEVAAVLPPARNGHHHFVVTLREAA
jgi:hypothetical protein